MRVLMLDGPRKGQVQEVPYHVAERLVRLGSARDLRAPEPKLAPKPVDAGEGEE